MKTLKWIGLGVLAVVVIAVVAGYIILSSYDFNDLKPVIAQQVKEATGRELTMKGDIDLKISFTPSLSVEDVSLQNASWGSRPEMATIKRAEVEVALIPLLSGNLELQRLILVEPDILIETDKKGRSNLDFKPEAQGDAAVKAAPGGSSGAVEAPKTPEPGASSKGADAAVWIKKLNIQKAVLRLNDGQTGQKTELKVDDLQAGAETMDSPLTFTIKGAYNQSEMEFNGQLGSLTSMMEMKAPLPVKVKGQMAGSELTLDGVIKNPADFKGVDLTFALKTPEIANLAKAGGQMAPISGPVEVSGRLTDPADQVVRIDDFKLNLAGSDLTGWFQFSQKKILTVDAELKAGVLDLRPLMASKSGSGGSMSEVKEVVEGPKGDAAKAGQGKSGQSQAASKRVFPSDPLPVDALYNKQVRVKFRAGQVLTPSLSVKDLVADVNLSGGEFLLKPLSAKVGGGDFEGAIRLSGAGKDAVLALDLALRNCRLETILAELGNKDKTLEGNLEVQVNVKGRGKSVAEIMASLNGRDWITLKDGKIHNSYVNFAGGDLQNLLLDRLNPTSESRDYTELPCFVQGFDIKKGIAELSAMLIETDKMVMQGEGTVNLHNEELDIGIEPTPKKGVGLEEAKLSFSLGELVKPLKLSGTLADPGLGIDVVKAAGTVGKAVAGVAAFGGAGLLAGLVTGGSEQKDLCAIAVADAKGQKRPASSASGSSDKSGTSGQSGQSGTQESENPVKALEKGLGGAIKGLFGE